MIQQAIVDIFLNLYLWHIVFFGISKLYNACTIYLKLSPISKVKCMYGGPRKSKPISVKGQLQLLLLLFGRSGNVCARALTSQATALSLSCIPSPEPWSWLLWSEWWAASLPLLKFYIFLISVGCCSRIAHSGGAAQTTYIYFYFFSPSLSFLFLSSFLSFLLVLKWNLVYTWLASNLPCSWG